MTSRTIDPPIVTRVRFPAINKNDSMAGNEAELARENRVSKAMIVKEIELNMEEWLDFKNSMLTDRPEWFEGSGGTRAVVPDEYDEISESWTMDQWYKAVNSGIATAYSLCCRVIGPESRLFPRNTVLVDTQGSKYARYVGIEV